MNVPPFPFKILVLAPFRGYEKDLWPHEPVWVNRMNLDRVMEGLDLSLYIPLPKNLCPSEGLTFRFRRMKDFHPEGLMENHPFLKNLLEARKFVKEAKIRGLSDEDVYKSLKKWPDLPIELKFELKTPKAQPVPPHSSSVDDILKMVSLPEESMVFSGEAESFISQIDSFIREVLKHLFVCEDLRCLESVWQGLRFLIKEGGVNGDLKLKIFPVSFETLETALDHLVIDLIEDLPSLVILDLPLDNTPRSLEFFEKIALFSETLLVPTLTWITSKFFHIDTWEKIETLSFLPHHMEDMAFAKWRQLRKNPSSKWLVTTCNRFLNRYPYGPDNKPGPIYFEESQPLWLSPVWGTASLIGKSLLKTGWPTRFTDWQNIRIEGLALNRIEGDRYIPTEANFPEERIPQFIDVGMIPFISPMNKDMAFIPFETNVAGGSLKHQLFLSRITQFLFWCKDHLEKNLEPPEIEKQLHMAFSLFWERTGHLTPHHLDISVRKPKPENPPIVSIAMEPSHQILPSGERIVLELNW